MSAWKIEYCESNIENYRWENVWMRMRWQHSTHIAVYIVQGKWHDSCVWTRNKYSRVQIQWRFVRNHGSTIFLFCIDGIQSEFYSKKKKINGDWTKTTSNNQIWAKCACVRLKSLFSRMNMSQILHRIYTIRMAKLKPYKSKPDSGHKTKSRKIK